MLSDISVIFTQPKHLTQQGLITRLSRSSRRLVPFIASAVSSPFQSRAKAKAPIRRRSRSRLFLEHKGVRIYWTSGRKYSATWLSMRADTKPTGCGYKPGMFAPTGLTTWEGVPLDPKRMRDRNGHFYDDGYRYGHEPDFIRAAEEACRRAIDEGIITRGHAPDDAR